MLMSPNKDETTVYGCHCPGDMAVRMRKVLQTVGLVFECVPCYFRLLANRSLSLFLNVSALSSCLFFLGIYFDLIFMYDTHGNQVAC